MLRRLLERSATHRKHLFEGGPMSLRVMSDRTQTCATQAGCITTSNCLAGAAVARQEVCTERRLFWETLALYVTTKSGCCIAEPVLKVCSTIWIPKIPRR